MLALFTFYALSSGGKSKDAVVHWLNFRQDCWAILIGINHHRNKFWVFCKETFLGRKKFSFDQWCDQIGRFLKILGDKFSFKSSPDIWWHFGPFIVKSAVAVFWATFGENWVTFSLLSGRTAGESREKGFDASIIVPINR